LKNTSEISPRPQGLGQRAVLIVGVRLATH
jgi:hypothetical protein